MCVAALHRPAVIVSSAAYHRARRDLILMPSAVKPVFATRDQALVIKPLGTLSSRDQAALRATIAQLIG